MSTFLFLPFQPCPLKILKYGTNSFVLPEDTCIRALQDGQRFWGKLTTSVTNVGPTNSHPHGFVFLYIRRSNKRLIYVNVNMVMYVNSIFWYILYIVIIPLCTLVFVKWHSFYHKTVWKIYLLICKFLGSHVTASWDLMNILLII